MEYGEIISEQDIGDTVICDNCGDDYTHSDAKGGILFCSNGVCPKCTPDMLKSAKEYGEMEYVRARCPAGMTFKDFILRLRGGNNKIVIRKLKL